ncbi:type I-B CRISPR-associated protein Cas7/Cst2/DevR [Ureibacillus terrenus]|uniref:Type I-B CRISPR-associated protein Cas7/Cst2/DevR n=1 Tax=Ureibacillus terrenus TaxID=118246 RepID=A0A540V4Q4_9BACL|nr:type I-B CRISPR-associated protein Cas7/Cst2/DevR [Ureibacillus terrenus]MED3660531.1 type I-B CRISPR-associated protein Cas7/Cst2/DevR [Ureibacillus terrenus]MED3763900.1 type I-B CRISPR-associated protein Cas7/Cst2/DevR [Ureibacillus terrenus]TQE91729.1 type I-B CRISPR-associated protein Cas7/Cst2/DevR [Ureibacillus terrenus]
MDKKGLTLSIIFEAESANYGEGVGNVTSLKKISRGDHEMYTYISRQALRYNIVEQMGVNNTPIEAEQGVLQFHPDATIADYPEIDLFGYMKTGKQTKTRAAVVRLSNAIALESYNTDLEFLTNKGLLDRYNASAEDGKELSGGNIAQSEIHKSFYAYTVTVDLDKVGIDPNDGIEIPLEERADRVVKLLEAIKFLYRDIKGRRENLAPIFAIGGVYNIKNPFFENRLKLLENKLVIDSIENVLDLDEEIKANTKVGLVRGILSNDDEIAERLNAMPMAEFFKALESEVRAYYK